MDSRFLGGGGKRQTQWRGFGRWTKPPHTTCCGFAVRLCVCVCTVVRIGVSLCLYMRYSRPSVAGRRVSE